MVDLEAVNIKTVRVLTNLARYTTFVVCVQRESLLIASLFADVYS